ncbi:uncharacterized protein A1O9_11242 [Exophiala aquamarina CBS 119918]|uniref:AB hydrolase-1 domain-containing protein n=1 Tax=Exophiala aquamarina CBS 119918 TaxID=1182545 RepID=A0A072PBA6_9EURO|nr:uncharacterized protein A1O9_11242 [Exophiala aquamarina CBS 119918]KEF52825.1 hypothetical protein A1O9_11242 [Exophiala aquamarina CBS 119918]
MGAFSTLLSGLALAACASMASARKCQNITIPVSISARNGVFNVATPQNNIDVTNLMLKMAKQESNYTAEVLTGYATVSGDYELAATFCTPDKGPGKTLQILTHGVGFDRGYWDIPFNNYNYSYVETAVDQYGCATLSWDRLGIAMSEHGEPVDEIQSFLEIAALKAVTRLARTQKLPGEAQGRHFDKIVHVGHSFGSIQSYALARDEPALSDGLILTGFSANGTFLPFFQLGGNFVSVTSVPAAASQYVAGYLAAGNPSALQTNFFAPGAFDPASLDFAYKTGQPVTVGELFTIAGAAGGVNKFPGPVLVITGERDVPFCGGDCLATGGNPSLASIPAAVQNAFPASRRFETFIVPGAGHGLNFEYSKDITYQHISQFLVGNGLA